MKNLKELWSRLNKKLFFTICGVVVLLILVIMLISGINGKANKTLTCTREETHVEGFDVSEKIKLKVRKNIIKNIEVEKGIKIKGNYTKFPTYYSIIEKTLKNAYAYVPEKELKLEKKENEIIARYETNKTGVILDNIVISLNDPANKFDISFNTQSNFEASSTTYKIGDEYKPKTLKKNIEELGYTCK